MAATVFSRWFRSSTSVHAQRKPVRSQLVAPALLEDRIAPAIFTATINPAVDNTNAVLELVGFVNKANTSNEPDTIVLWPNATYTFTAAADTNEGANALPSIIEDGAGKNAVTFQGNGATFFRNTSNANQFRFLRVTGTNANLIVKDLKFQGGNAGGTSVSGSGGAILSSSNGILNVSDSTFVGNTSNTDGGAVAVLNGAGGSTSSFTRTVFDTNTAGGTGGAVIATSFGFSSFVDSQIINNVALGASFGAGGVSGSGFLVFDFNRVTFSGNVGTSSGAFEGAEANFTTCSVLGNTANTGGTGGLNANLADITVSYSTIANNVGKFTSGSGGGINGNKVIVTNSTIHNNESGLGGGIAGRDITVTYSTITNNKSTFGIASTAGVHGIFSNTPIVLSHTVVAGNLSTAGVTDAADVSASTGFSSKGFNFIGIKPASITLLSSDISGTTGSPANPQLGALQNNGGLTLSRAPLAGSPLINAGSTTLVSPVTTDQRGYPRIVNTNADIGAFEVQTTNGVGIVAGNLQSTKITTAFSTGLQVVVTNPNGGLVSGATVVFAGPTFGAGPEFSGAGTSQSATTNASGIATLGVQANGLAGNYLVNASVGALPPVAFTLRNTNYVLVDPPTFGIVAGTTGSNQSTQVNGFFANPVTIQLTSLGVPVANVPVTFTAPLTGASAKFSNGGQTITVLTDSTGTATASLQANSKAGAFTINAAAAGYGTATYTLTNLAGSASTMTVVSGSGQTAFLSTPFAFPLVVQVLDAFGNPSPGQTVTFDPPASGAFANFTSNTAVTDANGVASSTIPVANAIGGTYVVTATSLIATTNFTLTNLAPPPPPPAANTAPIISPVAGQTGTTGQSVGPISFIVNDLETPANNLVVSATSSNTALIPLSGVVLGGTGSVRTVTLVPLAGQTGNSTITLTVTDAGSLTGTSQFVFTVNAPTLTPPTITPIANQTVATGGTAGPLGFVIGDAQTAANILTVTATAANTTLFPTGSLVLAGTGANRSIQLTPALGQTGSSQITVTVTDTDGMTTNAVFTTTVTPPPATPPSITDLADVSVTMNKSGGPYSFIVTDALTPAANLTVTATSSNQTLLPNAKVVLGGSGNFRTVTVTPTISTSGTSVVTITVTNGAGQSTSDTFTVTVPAIIPVPPPSGFVVGTSAGVSTLVQQYSSNAVPGLIVQPYDPSDTAGARVARGDFNGDGVLDIAVGNGPGSAPLVRVFDGVSGTILSEVRPFEDSFTGGLFVAAGDINGDGKADLVVTPDVGGSSRTVIYDGGSKDKQIANFFGIDDARFRGGARCAVGDLNKDGKADVIIAAGFGGGPRIAAFNGATMDINGGSRLFGDFFAYAPNLTNGTYVATGDINGDGYADLIVGAGPGGGPRVTAFSGQALSASGTQTALADFFAGSSDLRTGVRVATANLDGDNQLDIVVGNGGGSATVRSYLGSSSLFGTPVPHFEVDTFAGSTNGVFVG